MQANEVNTAIFAAPAKKCKQILTKFRLSLFPQLKNLTGEFAQDVSPSPFRRKQPTEEAGITLEYKQRIEKQDIKKDLDIKPCNAYGRDNKLSWQKHRNPLVTPLNIS